MKNKIINIIKNKHFYLIILIIFASLPVLLSFDIPKSHDILFHLTRIKGINYQIVNNLLFSPIYHNLISNMGYALPIFYSDIFLYPFGYLYKFFSMPIIYKLLLLSINLATTYSINFVLKKMFKNKKIVIFGTILYVLTPYRLVDLYIRGAIGECLAFIFIPFVILGLEELFNGDKKKYYYIIIGMTGLIYSHVISTYLTGIFILFYLLFNIKKLFKEKRYLYLLKSVLITFLLTCNYLLPLLEQMFDRNFYIHYIEEINSFNNTYVPFYKWFFEMPMPSLEWVPLGIGIIYLYFVILAFKYRKKIKNNNLTYLYLGIIFLVLTTNIVPDVIYNKVLIYIQYQWRFYLLATICLFFLGMNIFSILKDNQLRILKIMIIASFLIVMTNILVTNSLYSHFNELDDEYLGYYDYLPNDIDVDDVLYRRIKSSCNNDIFYNATFNVDRTIVEYSKNIYDDTVLTLPLLYYKGYTTNKNYDIINNNGLVAVKLNDSEDKVEIYYEETKIMIISRVITLITIIYFTCKYFRKGEKDAKT